MKQIYVVPPNPLISKSGDPIAYQRKLTYLWVPEVFFNGLVTHMPCPKCGDVKGAVVMKGWSKKPRIVAGEHDSYFIVCKRYNCRICKTTFHGYNEQSLAHLPVAVQENFPAVVTCQAAIDKQLLRVLNRATVNNQSFEDFRDSLREFNASTYYSYLKQYMDVGIWRKVRTEIGRYELTRKLPDFGPFLPDGKHENSYPGHIASTSFLKKCYLNNVSKSAKLKTCKLMGLTGDILCGDHTFAVAKVPTQNYTKIFEGLYSIMNEYGQIMAYYMTCSKTLSEIEDNLKRVAARYDDGGPKVFYTDLCCKERSFLKSLFPSLDEGERQRVLLDPFHFFKRYPVSKSHPLYTWFCSMMRDAAFIADETDMQRVKSILQRRLSQEEIDNLPRSYFTSKMKRHIPRPDVLFQRFDQLIQTFRSVDRSFITDAVLKAHENCMKHVNEGCLSDHPAVSLYFAIDEGSDTKLPKFKCARGSSQLEGFHYYVANSTSGKTTSPFLFDMLLLELVTRWNIDREIKCKLRPDFYCYDLGLLEEIHSLWKDHDDIFHSSPLQGYEPVKVVEDNLLERFGCSRFLDKDVVAELRGETAHQTPPVTLVSSSLDADDDDDEEDVNDDAVVACDDEETVSEENPSQAIHLLDESDFDDDERDQQLPITTTNIVDRHLDTFAEDVEETENLEVATTTPTAHSRELDAKVLVSPCPAAVTTSEEVHLYVELYSNQLLRTPGKINFALMTVEWNERITQLLETTELRLVKTFFKTYRFKSEFHLKKFKDEMLKKVQLRIILQDKWSRVTTLQKQLQESSGFVHRPAVPFNLPAIYEEQDVELSDQILRETMEAAEQELNLVEPIGDQNISNANTIPPNRTQRGTRKRTMQERTAEEIAEFYQVTVELATLILRKYSGEKVRICYSCHKEILHRQQHGDGKCYIISPELLDNHADLVHFVDEAAKKQTVKTVETMTRRFQK